MRKADRVIAGLATLLLATSLTACASGGAIATVNGAAISKSAFDNKLESSPTALGTLQQMVREMLLDQYAKQNNITASDDEIAKREDEIKANFPNGSWDQMLKARGLTENDVHSLLSQQIIIDKAVGKDIKITDAQIKAYFDKNHAAFDKPAQVRARHILVADLATANKVEALLKQGKDFATLAHEYSTDPGSKDKGGELGFFRRGQMVPAFDKYVFSAPVNVISPPVKSPFGYHIIQVEEIQPGVTATLANTRSRIVDTLRQQQEGPLIAPFLQSLQAKATIVVTDPRFQAAFPSPAPADAAPAAAAPAASPK
ncbi:MAG TPA: peptidylprolyl isomerase [Candidatus Baltobacteraceae bacterium]|nr:peptidylprolyl isomerase [Candidatus Baltobacteraceae bacterium]